jgi:hypothetical protein
MAMRRLGNRLRRWLRNSQSEAGVWPSAIIHLEILALRHQLHALNRSRLVAFA